MGWDHLAFDPRIQCPRCGRPGLVYSLERQRSECPAGHEVDVQLLVNDLVQQLLARNHHCPHQRLPSRN